MVRLLCRDDWSVRCEHEVNPGIWHQIGLELRNIHIESTIKAEGSGPRCVQYFLSSFCGTGHMSKLWLSEKEGERGRYGIRPEEWRRRGLPGNRAYPILAVPTQSKSTRHILPVNEVML